MHDVACDSVGRRVGDGRAIEDRAGGLRPEVTGERKDEQAVHDGHPRSLASYDRLVQKVSGILTIKGERAALTPSFF